MKNKHTLPVTGKAHTCMQTHFCTWSFKKVLISSAQAYLVIHATSKAMLSLLTCMCMRTHANPHIPRSRNTFKHADVFSHHGCSHATAHFLMCMKMQTYSVVHVFLRTICDIHCFTCTFTPLNFILEHVIESSTFPTQDMQKRACKLSVDYHVQCLRTQLLWRTRSEKLWPTVAS